MCVPHLYNTDKMQKYSEVIFISVITRIQHKNKDAFSSIVFYATRVEAGSNTSTVTLRVVGGDEKGSLKYETVKYGHEFYGTRTRK
jgi:hypothetical protein